MSNMREISKLVRKSRLPKENRKIIVHNLSEIVSIIVHNLEKVPKDETSIIVHNLNELVSIIVHNLEKVPDPKELTSIIVHNTEKLIGEKVNA